MDKRNSTTGNMALLQAGRAQEFQPLSLSITFGAWRQVTASKPRLQQALKRYGQLQPRKNKQTFTEINGL